ncbi:Asialoglycoprotein receptor 1 [Amphibalanus amphitrite]|uniref:Asialoglycoprotein receptor 1 n=1 Tax=Amphibalanus amphitrite TaxID=1232801 RepID=A0A6A4VEH9_AMPAM|nr:Asialoglycoprotein receptor 1 [Amphibalanus amphitrite]
MPLGLLALLLALSRSARPVQGSRGLFYQHDGSVPFLERRLESAHSVPACAARCLAHTEFCGAIRYRHDTNACSLMTLDESCWPLLPAVGLADPTQDVHGPQLLRRGTHTCSGSSTERCACPAGFSRCAGRCLRVLPDLAVYADAEQACAALSAHLAVPRSEQENQCAQQMIGGGPVWLGVSDRSVSMHWEAADGCGTLPVPQH